MQHEKFKPINQSKDVAELLNDLEASEEAGPPL